MAGTGVVNDIVEPAACSGDKQVRHAPSSMALTPQICTTPQAAWKRLFAP